MFRKKDKEAKSDVKGLYDSMIQAEKIVENPGIIDEYPERYWIIWDASLGLKRGVELKNLQKAINILARNGWRCINISAIGQINGAYALMEKEE